LARRCRSRASPATNRRRSAGTAATSAARRSNVRDGELRPRQRGCRARVAVAGRARDRGGVRRLRGRGRDPLERCRDPVAARRPRDPRRRRRERGAGAAGRVDRRRLLRPSIERSRLAALERQRARSRHRHHARHERRPGGPGSARGNRLPGRRRAGPFPWRRGRVARRRGGERQQLPDAVPGRSARLSRRGHGGTRETTALGAAALAGVATGIRPNLADIRARIRRGATYEPSHDPDWVAGRRAEWQLAVRRAVLI
jgi:hypothetical protein